MSACVEDGLGGGFDGGAGRVGAVVFRRHPAAFGEGEVVIHDGIGIAIIAFQTAGNSTHKGVVHGGAEDAEVEKGGVWQHKR